MLDLLVDEHASRLQGRNLVLFGDLRGWEVEYDVRPTIWAFLNHDSKREIESGFLDVLRHGVTVVEELVIPICSVCPRNERSLRFRGGSYSEGVRFQDLVLRVVHIQESVSSVVSKRPRNCIIYGE